MTNQNIITIIGKEQARVNYRFQFHGYSNDCKTCKYGKACLNNLEAGRIYAIVKVTEKELECMLHGGKGKVVEVVEGAIKSAIDARMAIQDVLIEYTPIECGLLSCKNYEICSPQGLIRGDRCRIIKIMDTLDCNKGFSLVSVSLQRQT